MNFPDSNPDDREETRQSIQPPLFDITGREPHEPQIARVGPLTPDASLEAARYWYRRYLEQEGHPRNTVSSYMYDLAILEQIIGLKPINTVTQRDIARYLGEANTRSTRKRRLTSASGLFKWLTHQAKMLESDPTESFYPDQIPLKTPRQLSSEEQSAFLDAARKDSSRSMLMCWLMIHLGLTRGEVLGLRKPHIDFTDSDDPQVYVFYDDPRHRERERKLAAGPELTELYETFVQEYTPDDRLFDMLPQSVNKMTERVARAAGIDKKISPQHLRATYAVNQAREGADEEQLLALLGLADDPRNRMSVQRYIKLAAPASSIEFELP